MDEIADEEDVFRLAIRGYAAVEEIVDRAISEAFGGTVPAEIKRIHFGARLALAQALTGIPLGEHLTVVKALPSATFHPRAAAGCHGS